MGIWFSRAYLLRDQRVISGGGCIVYKGVLAYGYQLISQNQVTCWIFLGRAH